MFQGWMKVENYPIPLSCRCHPRKNRALKEKNDQGLEWILYNNKRVTPTRIPSYPFLCMHLSKDLQNTQIKKIIELRVKIETSTYKVEDFNTLLLVNHGMIKQKSIGTYNT